MGGKVIAVMPARNEEKHIASVIEGVRRYADEIVVVNDGSTDRTGEIAREMGCAVVEHEKSMGLGKSLRDGIEKALELGAEIVITIDADGQHNPDDIPKFLETINGHDFVLGERDLSAYPLVKRIGNWGLTLLTNLVCGTNLRDTESGFRAFKAGALKKMNLTAEKYEIAADFVFEAGRLKLKTANVRISSPLYHKGKGVSVKDGFRNFWFILRKKFK